MGCPALELCAPCLALIHTFLDQILAGEKSRGVWEGGSNMVGPSASTPLSHRCRGLPVHASASKTAAEAIVKQKGCVDG